jgi:hypothetical protein
MAAPGKAQLVMTETAVLGFPVSRWIVSGRAAVFSAPPEPALKVIAGCAISFMSSFFERIAFLRQNAHRQLRGASGTPKDQRNGDAAMSATVDRWDETRALAKAALHPSTSMTVKNGFLRLYSDVVRNDPHKAEDIDVLRIVARTVRDVHLSSVARQNGLDIIQVFLNHMPDWADSTVAQAVMKKRYFDWEHQAFASLHQKRPDLVEEEWQRKQNLREAKIYERDPVVPAKRRISLPRVPVQPA